MMITHAMEEMGELTQSLSKYLRDVERKNQLRLKDDIAEEICDVEIFLEKIKKYLELQEDVDRYKAVKIRRHSAYVQGDKL